MVDNNTTIVPSVGEVLYAKTFGLFSFGGCAGKTTDSGDNSTDPDLISENHPLKNILSTDLNELSDSSDSEWHAAVDEFLVNANGALTSGSINGFNNYPTSVFAVQGEHVINNDGSFSDVSFVILVPTDYEDEVDFSQISATQLIQDGALNLDLSIVLGYSGPYVMVGVVEGYVTDTEGFTGISVNLYSTNEDEFVQLNIYYIAGPALLKVNSESSNSEIDLHEEYNPVYGTDPQIEAAVALNGYVERLQSTTISVPHNIAF